MRSMSSRTRKSSCILQRRASRRSCAARVTCWRLQLQRALRAAMLCRSRSEARAILFARTCVIASRLRARKRSRETQLRVRGTIVPQARNPNDGTAPLVISEKAPPHKALRIMSGMRPTGRLHIGHLLGALSSWVEMSNTTEAFFEIADLHAYTTSFDDPQTIRDSREEMVIDWLAAGIDPERSTIYLQSAIPEISELHT